MDVEADRLSSLPDEVIHKILSFISIKQAIEISVLSTRWRFIWTSMPYLDCSSHKLLPEFVSNVFHHRNNQIHVSSIKLGDVGVNSYKTILDRTFSHNVQQLTFTLVRKSDCGSPLSYFRSRSLKHLNLIGGVYGCRYFMGTQSFDLPILTTLHLHDVTLTLRYAVDKGSSLFTKCTNLKNLALSRCRITGLDVLKICHPQLSNLTLQDTNNCETVDVVAPQLKNLSIIDAFWNISISAPALTSLVLKHHGMLQLSTHGQGLPSLEDVDICIRLPFLKSSHMLVSLFEQLHTVKFLTLNLEILEEIRVMRNIISTQGLIKYLRRTNKACIESTNDVKKQWIEEDLQCYFGKMMTKIKQMEFEGLKLSPSDAFWVISLLQKRIEGLLTRLPASKWDVMQAAYSSVCEQVAIVMNDMLDCDMKVRYNNKKPKFLDV